MHSYTSILNKRLWASLIFILAKFSPKARTAFVLAKIRDTFIPESVWGENCTLVLHHTEKSVTAVDALSGQLGYLLDIRFVFVRSPPSVSG